MIEMLPRKGVVEDLWSSPDDSIDPGERKIRNMLMGVGEEVISLSGVNVILDSRKELSERRKYIRDQRNKGLRIALDKRNAYAKKTKEDLKFAKRGYGRVDRRDEVDQEASRLEEEIIKGRKSNGRINESPDLKRTRNKIFGNLGVALEKRSNGRKYSKEIKRAKEDSKAFAKLAVRRREEIARQNLTDYELARQEAKARRSQTLVALLRSKLHLDGNRTNFISTYRDVGRTQEQRLAGLRSRSDFNIGYMNKGGFQKSRIISASEGMSDEAHQRRTEYFAPQGETIKAIEPKELTVSSSPQPVIKPISWAPPTVTPHEIIDHRQENYD